VHLFVSTTPIGLLATLPVLLHGAERRVACVSQKELIVSKAPKAKDSQPTGAKVSSSKKPNVKKET
jgi:hypothetical protein